MRKILLVWSILIGIFSCSSDSNSTSPNEEGSQTNSKPSDESEDLPGYLVDPTGFVLDRVSDSSSNFLIVAPANSVVGLDEDNSYVTIFGVRFGETDEFFTDISLLAVTKINSDGSFSISFDPSDFDSFFLQTVIGAPGNFKVNTDGDILSNTVFYSSLDGNVLPTYYNKTPQISEAAQNAISPISLIYLNKVPGQMTTEIEAQIELHNPSDDNFSLQDVEIRYFFDADGLSPVFEISSSTNIPLDKMTYGYDDAGKYIYFSVSDGVVILANDAKKIRFIVTNQELGTFNQANDPSFISTQTSKALSKKISIYKNGQKIWGDM